MKGTLILITYIPSFTYLIYYINHFPGPRLQQFPKNQSLSHFRIYRLIIFFKKLANIALVRSILEYGAVEWDPYQSRDIIAVEKVQRQAARFIKNDYKSRFEGCVTSMLEDIKLPILQQRRLESRRVMLYKFVRGTVINADEFLIPLRNKRHIKPRIQTDFQTTNFVQRYSVNHTECFKVPDSQTDQFKNSFFVRTISDWNQLEKYQIRAETVNSFRTTVHKSY